MAWNYCQFLFLFEAVRIARVLCMSEQTETARWISGEMTQRVRLPFDRTTFSLWNENIDTGDEEWHCMC